MDQTDDNSLWGGFKTWANRPFTTDMDAVHWFYFFGLIIMISLVWGLIMRHVYEGVGAVQRAV